MSASTVKAFNRHPFRGTWPAPNEVPKTSPNQVGKQSQHTYRRLLRLGWGANLESFGLLQPVTALHPWTTPFKPPKSIGQGRRPRTHHQGRYFSPIATSHQSYLALRTWYYHLWSPFSYSQWSVPLPRGLSLPS